jgi:hypothetical protein
MAARGSDAGGLRLLRSSGRQRPRLLRALSAGLSLSERLRFRLAVAVKEAAEPVRTARQNPGATASLTWRSQKRRSRKQSRFTEPQRLGDFHKKDVLTEEEFVSKKTELPGRI